MNTRPLLFPSPVIAIMMMVATMSSPKSTCADNAPTVTLSEEGLPLGDNYPYASPVTVLLSNDGGTCYVACHTGRRVDSVEMPTGTIRWSASLDGAASGLALDETRQRLFVAHGLNAGKVAIIHAKTGARLGEIQAGHTPSSPRLSPDGKSLYVAVRFDNEVAVFNTETHAKLSSLKVGREPIALALTPDGTTLVVAHHLPDQTADVPHVAANIHLVDAHTMTHSASITLANGATTVKDVSVSPDGRHAYITSTLARFHLPTTQLERGWMNTAALSIIDVPARSLYATVLLDDIDSGAANPWGVTCSSEGALLVVTHSGSHELSIIDRTALHKKIERVLSTTQRGLHATPHEQIQSDLAFLVGMRRRIALPGKGPRGVAIAGNTLVVAEYFSDSLAVIVDTGQPRPPIRSILPYPVIKPNIVRRGELAFYDANRCFQKWQTCATCHPSTRVDALNWDLLNDGMGNPKNTRNLLYSHETPPVMITGIRADAETAVRAGFRFIQFTQVSEETASSVDAYLRALRPVPSPHLVNGSLSASALRGRELFVKSGCAHCHSGPYFTDGKKYDVGTGPDENKILEFVTPTLIEVWRSAPYMFNGSAETVRRMFSDFNPDDRHGRTSSLTDAQLDDLVEYVLSL